MKFNTDYELNAALFSAAVVLQAVQYSHNGSKDTDDPLYPLMMRYLEGELYYTNGLSAIVRRLYLFVKRAIAHPDRHIFNTGEQRMIADALAAYDGNQSEYRAARAELVADLLEDGHITHADLAFRWSGLNERFLALDS